MGLFLTLKLPGALRLVFLGVPFWLFFGHFYTFWDPVGPLGVFIKNTRMWRTSPYSGLTSCKVSENSEVGLIEKSPDRHRNNTANNICPSLINRGTKNTEIDILKNVPNQKLKPCINVYHCTKFHAFSTRCTIIVEIRPTSRNKRG